MFVICEDGHGAPLMVLGPCWIVGLFTFLLIGGLSSAIFVVRLGPEHSVTLWAIGGILLAATAGAFCFTCTSDPGKHDSARLRPRARARATAAGDACDRA